ncbi:MAG: patatin-like phospholipase family protein [Sphingobacteriales bacterium]|nr:patatin-like phospholipase family protein [Sphingobacteriales bacterium]
MKRLIYLLILFIFLTLNLQAQRVGLVLSGGAAKGLAHVGVLKALEENNIPIDYITGTSMGGLVGGMYAAGYSASEMEYIATSKDFQEWVSGNFEADFTYYYERKAVSAAIISLGLGLDSIFQARLRSNLINDIPLNFALLELTAQASINSNWNFDSLMIPYRCMIADVFSQQQIAVKNGSLGEAMRATMTVPYVFRPIKINGRYVFDGGLYNNFPVDVMRTDFNPDVIIGVNVSSKTFKEYPFKNDEEAISKLFNYLLLSKSDSSLLHTNDIYIQPDVYENSVVDFKNPERLIQLGYEATMAKMPQIKAQIARQQTLEQKKEMRNRFNDRQSPIIFNALRFTGVNNRQKVYIRNVIKQDYNRVSLYNAKRGYYLLVSDQNFRTVFPRIVPTTKGMYDFELDVKPERNVRAQVGGNISSRPINTVYFGLDYSYLNSYFLSMSSDFYLGRFYESAALSTRLDFTWKRPISLSANFVYNHWNYFKSSDLFIQEPVINYVDQSDKRLMFTLSTPAKFNGKWMLKVGGFNNRDLFSQTNIYSDGDQLDRSVFNALKYAFEYENNTLNQKQFAFTGHNARFSLQYIDGVEKYIPGTESILIMKRKHQQWIRLSTDFENYYSVSPKYKIGAEYNLVVSNQPLFASYRSSILNATAFYPLIDSRTFLLENYRAFSYAGVGIKNVYLINKNLQARIEGYYFQPYQKIMNSVSQKAELGKPFAHRYLTGIASLVYKSPVGPISVNTSYYDNTKEHWFFLFNMGYIIFQKRASE